MKKGFFNAKIYRNDAASEIVVEDGKITQIGTSLKRVLKENYDEQTTSYRKK